MTLLPNRGKVMPVRSPSLHSHKMAILSLLASACCLAGCGASDSARKNEETPQPTQEQTTKSQSDTDHSLDAPLAGIFPSGDIHVDKRKVFAKYLKNNRGPKFLEEDLISAADKACDRFDYEDAIILAQEAILINPKNATAHYQLGRAELYSTNSNDASSLAAFQKAVALKFPRADAYQLMAVIYDARHDTKQALDCLAKAIAMEPTNKILYKNRAAILVANGMKEEAKRDYDKWLTIEPGDTTPRLMRGELFETMGKYDAALADYKAAEAKRPDGGSMSETKTDMGRKLHAKLLSKLKRHDEAMKVLTEGLKNNDSDDELLKLRGDEYAYEKKYDLAIKDYTASIEAAPKFSRETLEARSKAYAAIGKTDLAEKDAATASKQKEAPAEKPLYSIHDDVSK